MRQSGSAKRQFGSPDTQTVAERVNDFLRSRYPRDTAKLAEAATGVPAKTIAKWLTRSSAPSGPALLACLLGLGPEFLVAVCPGLAWAEHALAAMCSASLHAAIERSEGERERTFAKLRGRR